MRHTSEPEAVRESCTDHLRPCWNVCLLTRVLMVVFLCSLLVVSLHKETALGSEERDPYQGFMDGIVTAVRDKSLYINERPFAVKSGVEVKDQYGQRVEYQQIEAGDHIRYLVQDGMVIKIIVIHPS